MAASGHHEIERKFLPTRPAAAIEAAALADGTLLSTARVAQRYLATKGWRLRAKRTTRGDAAVRTLTLKCRVLGERLDFTIDEDAWEKLAAVCDRAPRRRADGPGVRRLHLDDLSDWTVRLRRTEPLAAGDLPVGPVRHQLTLKRGITLVSCNEIESDVPAGEHDLAIPLLGPAIFKRRTCIRVDSHVWELDVYLNPELDGIEVAEVEIDAEDAPFARPRWAGIEVTEDRRYKNARMAKRLAD